MKLMSKIAVKLLYVTSEIHEGAWLNIVFN